MAWFGPTGSCGCCDPCPIYVSCSGGDSRERTPQQITFVLENLPNEIYYRYTTVADGFIGTTNYYMYVRLSNIQSLEGTYTINLQDIPQTPAGRPVNCSYTVIDFQPSISVEANITPDTTGCPSTLISRSITNIRSTFRFTAEFDTLSFGPYFPLITGCSFRTLFNTTPSVSPYTSPGYGYSFGASWYISERVVGGFFDGLKLCGFRNGNLARNIPFEVTDCVGNGPQAADDSTWQYD